MTEKEEKAIAILRNETLVQTVKEKDVKLAVSIKQFKAIDTVLKSLEQKDKEIQELKEKWNKDTHTLQNQLDLANADRVEKDKMIDLMAETIEYYYEENKEEIKQVFQKKAREENEK